MLTGPRQTRTVELPSDSNFAVAMKTQQQAEREEQQRIKNLVLNYDLRENEEQESNDTLPPVPENMNVHMNPFPDPENKPASFHHNRPNKLDKERGGHRSRKLQLSDMDWYGSPRSEPCKLSRSDETGGPESCEAAEPRHIKDRSWRTRAGKGEVNQRVSSLSVAQDSIADSGKTSPRLKV